MLKGFMADPLARVGRLFIVPFLSFKHCIQTQRWKPPDAVVETVRQHGGNCQTTRWKLSDNTVETIRCFHRNKFVI